MRIKGKRTGVALVALSAMAISVAGVADAASTTNHQERLFRAGGSTNAPGIGGNSAETVLTGATLQSASDAATRAVPGGTVEVATIENPNHPTGAAYEVHVTKTDGSHVEVLEDTSFKVLSVNSGPGPGGGPGGPGGNETALTGSTLKSASDAASAALPGGTVTAATIEDKNHKSGATYEAHVTKTDGSKVEVLEDGAFKVLSVNAGPSGGPGGPRGPGGPPPSTGGH